MDLIGLGLPVATPAMLARPGSDPDPADPHAAVGRLVEAFVNDQERQ
jgi:hypothetical protein